MTTAAPAVGPELDAEIAKRVFGLQEGVDFGTWPEHDWKRDEDGEIDMLAMESEGFVYHNGPRCIRCLQSYCEHCESESKLDPCTVKPDRYSTWMPTSWSVVEHFRERGYLVRVQVHPDGYPFFREMIDPATGRGEIHKRAMCLIENVHPGNYFIHGRGYGMSAEEVICRAALDALDSEAGR